MNRRNRTNPWPSSLAETQEDHLQAEPTDPAQDSTSVPAPASFHNGVPRTSGAAPLHSVPRDIDLEFGAHPVPPSVRTSSDLTTQPRDLEPVDEVPLPLRSSPDEVAAAALLFGIEQEPRSRFAPKSRPKASPEALAAGASAAAHAAVAPPQRQSAPVIEDKVVIVGVDHELMGSPDDEVTNPAARATDFARALAEYNTEPSGMPPLDPDALARDRAKRQEKTVDIRRRFPVLAVGVFIGLFLSVILAASVAWPIAESYGEAPKAVDAPVNSLVIHAASPLPDAPILAPILAPALDAVPVTPKKPAAKKRSAVPVSSHDAPRNDRLFQRTR